MVKINGTCPAAIRVSVFQSKVNVTYQKMHVGHNFDTQYLKLRKFEKDYIPGKLLQGFPFAKIIQDIKNDESLAGQRIKSVSRKDLHNIMKSYRVEWNGGECHSDLKNTEDWVEQLKDFPSSPVLICKPHGLCLQHLNLYKLLNRDFMLGFMTDGQQQVFEILPQSVIGVCCLHDSNSHGFFLVTVFVIDQSRVPFPIAYCFTNRYDEVGMKAFFNAIKNRVGKIVASLLISDCLHECYSAWAHVMAQPRRAFYFPRLLHHWRKNVSKMCGEYEKKQNVYDALMAVSQESDQAHFEHLLKTFVDQVECDDDLKEFVSYFKNDFLNEVDVWSACHYASEGLPEVSHLEELEKKLSDVCFHAGLPKGVDLSVRELLLMTHSKVYEHVANVCRGTEFLERIIMLDHKNNEQLYSREIEYNSDSGKWKVKMANDDSTYSVQKTDEHPDDKKELYCPLCKAFLNPYFCNCMDYLVECKVCEHVHAVACSSEPECEIISCDESFSADLQNGDTEVFSCEETVIFNKSIHTTEDMTVVNFEVVF